MSEKTTLSTDWIVDDSQEILDSLKFLLESVGYEVNTFNECGTFLQNYAPTESACLLLDVHLPDMIGLALQEKLKKDHICLPIIFMTGHGEVEMAVQAMKAGAYEFLTKPSNGQILLSSLKQALASQPERTQVSHAQEDQAKSLIAITP